MADAPPVLDKKPTARDIAQRLIMRHPGIKEVATLHVNGRLYSDWTSVRVESRVSQPYSTFMFECSEETPVPLQQLALQFLPGDKVRVHLGGQLALVGYIDERHVAYDASQHAVRLMGCGDTRDMVTSTVPPEKLDGHDGQNWQQLALDISSHLGIKIKLHGAVDLHPFQKVGIQPGETIMNVIERHARMRNIVIGSNFDGGLLGIGEHNDVPLGVLEEGVHILRANAVIRDPSLHGVVISIGQGSGGSSGGGGAAQDQQKCYRQGSHTRPKVMLVPVEISDDAHGVCRRADMELVFTQGSEVEANITVQGWFKDNNKLDAIWRANESYVIKSPSLCMNGVVLGCAACVYEQSEAGTTTTLTMVTPIHLNKAVNIRVKTIERANERAEEHRLRQQDEEMRTRPGDPSIKGPR